LRILWVWGGIVQQEENLTASSLHFVV